MRWLWPASLLPGAIGLALALAILTRRLADPILFARMDVATLAAGAGLALSLVAALCVVAARRLRTRERVVRQDAESGAAAERRRFVLRLDHELKNPLTAIEAGLANLAGEEEPEACQRIAQGIESQAQRIGRLAADLRKLAEMETRPLQAAPVDLQDLLQEVVASAQETPRAAGRQLILTVPRAPWPLPRVSGDRDLLFLAVYNLLDNALKFSRAEDTVEIRAYEGRASVVIEVADTGPGIPQGETEQVWEELYRGKAARGVPGSGLGLALVRAITLRHGGQVAIQSRSGQGTVVTLRLPA